MSWLNLQNLLIRFISTKPSLFSASSTQTFKDKQWYRMNSTLSFTSAALCGFDQQQVHLCYLDSTFVARTFEQECVHFQNDWHPCESNQTKALQSYTVNITHSYLQPQRSGSFSGIRPYKVMGETRAESFLGLFYCNQIGFFAKKFKKVFTSKSVKH